LEEINSQFEILDRHENQNLFNRLDLSFLTILKHSSLFVVTYISVAFTVLFVGFMASVPSAILFAAMLLLFLGTHEFGHYIASVIHRVKTTLPYFIPVPIISPIGTMGAVIRIKERVEATKKLFDIGIAGPLAGFVVSLGLLIIGMATSPSTHLIMGLPGHENLKEFILQFHKFPSHPLPEKNGAILMLGNTLLFDFLRMFFHNVPPMWEMYHYPVIFAGWLGLFFTALNLMPIGQLDGGHILYALVGRRNHKIVARLFFAILTVLCGIGLVPMLSNQFVSWDYGYGVIGWLIWAAGLYMLLRKSYDGEQNWMAPVWAGSLISTAVYIYVIAGAQNVQGNATWLVWTLFLAFLVKLDHPPVLNEQKLDRTRMVLGWLSMIIFILCISPDPIYLLNP